MGRFLAIAPFHVVPEMLCLLATNIESQLLLSDPST